MNKINMEKLKSLGWTKDSDGWWWPPWESKFYTGYGYTLREAIHLVQYEQQPKSAAKEMAITEHVVRKS